MRGKGYRRNPAGHRITRFGSGHTIGAANAPTPDAIDLRTWAPNVMDQGQTGSCTGHGTSTALATAFAGARPIFIPSPAEIYRNARAIDRVFLLGKPSAPLSDIGAEPNQVRRAIEEFGIRPTRAPAPDGRNSDADSSTIDDEPTLADVEVEVLNVPVGIYGIESHDTGRALPDIVTAVRQALSSGYPVCFGIYVDTGFENWTPSKGPVTALNQMDPDGGGHWLCCLGYTTQPDGSTHFLGRNSWGIEWGDQGDFTFTDAFLAQCTDITVFVPRKA